jgi:hypothetical protein
MPFDKVINLVNNSMSVTEKVILNALETGNFRLSVHAVSRMNQRTLTAADIISCGQTAKCCIYQAQHGTWRIDGKDLDGEILTAICAVDNGVVIVTIF